MSKKVRIFDAAKTLNVSTNFMMKKLKTMGVPVRKPFDRIDEEMLEKVRETLATEQTRNDDGIQIEHGGSLFNDGMSEKLRRDIEERSNRNGDGVKVDRSEGSRRGDVLDKIIERVEGDKDNWGTRLEKFEDFEEEAEEEPVEKDDDSIGERLKF